MIYKKRLIDEPGENRISFLKSNIEQVMSERRNNVTAVR